MVQEAKMKDREPLNKINMSKKAKARIELGNLAKRSIIPKICPDLTKYNEVLYATAKWKPRRRKPLIEESKSMWKKKIEK